jgi:hypothetical protein
VPRTLDILAESRSSPTRKGNVLQHSATRCNIVQHATSALGLPLHRSAPLHSFCRSHLSHPLRLRCSDDALASRPARTGQILTNMGDHDTDNK